MNNRGVVKLNFKQQGFTLVELLIVIAVIAILVTLTVVAYNGVTKNAIVASLQSDLTSARDQIKLFQLDKGSFPNSITDCPTPAAGNICAKVSPGNTYTYNVDNTATPDSYGLTAVNASNSLSYRVNSVSAAPVACAPGFIIVPGNTTYGTSDFCVMKYAAIQMAATVPGSEVQELNKAWVNISQATAITYSKNVIGCTGCHLMSNAEWMTVAQNVLSVPSNWSGGAVGSGYIYSGHNDSVPAYILPPSSDDSDGYYETGDTSPSSQRRTLTLTNGEVIWDLSGNVYEWTSDTIGPNQQPGLAGETVVAWKQWNNPALLQNGLPSTSMPSSTGLSGASTWDSDQGIGELYSNYGDTGTKVITRGRSYAGGVYTGVLAMHLGLSTSSTSAAVGFRVAR